MGLVKTCATVLAIVLFSQTGCDLWCNHADRTKSAGLFDGNPVPPCHGTHDPGTPEDKRSTDHETSRECVHPQAVGGNSKFEAKVAKTIQPIGSIEIPDTQGIVHFYAWAPIASMERGIKPAGTPVTVLRI